MTVAKSSSISNKSATNAAINNGANSTNSDTKSKSFHPIRITSICEQLWYDWCDSLIPYRRSFSSLIGLKHHEDLRCFFIVGLYYTSIIWRWKRYKAFNINNNSDQVHNAYDYPERFWNSNSPISHILYHSIYGADYPSSDQILNLDNNDTDSSSPSSESSTLWLNSNLHPILDLLWLTVTCTLAFFSATIVHNTIHSSPFVNYHVNTVWHVILTHTYGHPVSTLIPGHNLSHHKYVQTPKDVMRTTRMRWENNFLNLIMFVPSILPNITKQDNKYFKISYEKGNHATFYRMRFEQLCYYPLQLYLAYYSFQRYYWIILIPQLFAKLGIISMNLLQHDGCLVLKELGETPDPHIAIGSMSEVTLKEKKLAAASTSDSGKNSLEYLDLGKEYFENKIFDKDIYGENHINDKTNGPNGKLDEATTTSTTDESSSSNISSPSESRDESRERNCVTNESNSSTNNSINSNTTSNLTLRERKLASDFTDDTPHLDRSINHGKRPGDKGYLYNPDYNFSRDFTGTFINWWTCNNGYHSIHHVRPSMHWSKYPEYSKKLVEPYQHEELRQKNLLKYLVKTFIYPGIRVTWDGRDYYPSEADYDMDWVDIFFKVFNDPHRVN